MIRKLGAGHAVAALLPLVCACHQGEPPAYEEVRPVHTVVAGRGNATVGATYSGEVRARHETRLGFQNGGRITQRSVEVGARVRRGQVLMRLDPAQEILHVAASTAGVEAARNRVAQNRVDLARTEQLFARQFASQAEVDQQRLALAESEAQLKSATAQQQINVNQRGYTTLTADRDGVVSAIKAEAGQVVSAGQQVVVLAGDGEREIAVSVPEHRVAELKGARELTVSLWARRDRTYRGRLRELAPDADGVTRTYSARITLIDPDDAVLLGMTASVRVPDVAGTAGIRLPLAAVFEKDGAQQVWLVDPSTSRVAPRRVRVGAAHNDSLTVVDGIGPGDTVVVAGVHMLMAGQKVKAVGPIVKESRS